MYLLKFLGEELAFRIGNQSIIILTLCTLILMRMVDFAVFDDHNNDHSVFNVEAHHTVSDHENLGENDQQHSNEHALHDMYHSVSSTYIQSTVEEFAIQNVDASLTTTRYDKISKTISFIPPVPPPLA